MDLSVIVPVYNEEKNIPEFLHRTLPILEGIAASFEIIFAMDPSSDRTEEVILDQRSKDRRIKLLKFSRRFGQPMATLAGLQYCQGDAAIVINVNLQDPPELIREMVARWRERLRRGDGPTAQPDRRNLGQTHRVLLGIPVDQQGRRGQYPSQHR